MTHGDQSTVREFLPATSVQGPSKRKHVSRVLLVALAGVCLPHAAVAQSAQPEPASNTVVVPQNIAAMNTLPSADRLRSINGAQPDIAALRYYAVRGEQDRVQAEIARLRRIYPNWQAPKNIFAPQDDREKPLWDLFAKGDLNALQTRISAMKSRIPGYQPSRELLSKMQQKALRKGIEQAQGDKNWQTVIDQANANPELLLGNDVEVIWFLAEAYARKERPKESREAFQAALRVATTDGERLATVQKAAGLLNTEAALELMNSSPELKANADLAHEATDGIVRGALARASELGERLPKIIQPHLDGFAVRTRMGRNAADSTLLAWSYFGQRNWEKAREWFQVAMEIEPTAKSVEGGIMTAMRRGDMDYAAGLAGKWLNASPEIGALFISVHARELLKAKPRPMAGQFLETYAGKTAELNNGEGAEALGWFAYNTAQLDAAHAWFAKAMEWEETETAAFGVTLTAARARDRATWNVMQANYGPRYPKVASVKYHVPRKAKRLTVKRRSSKIDRAGKLRKTIAAMHKAKRYNRCLELTRKLRGYGPLKAGDHQMRGWCLLNAKRPAEAERAFDAAVRLGGKSRVPSAYGHALAALRTGKTNQALAIANANQLTARQRRVVDIELLTQRARAAFDNRDYGATLHALDRRRQLTGEPRDLALLRGWSHVHTHRYQQAHAVFSMLDGQMSSRDTQRGLAAIRRQRALAISNDK